MANLLAKVTVGPQCDELQHDGVGMLSLPSQEIETFIAFMRSRARTSLAIREGDSDGKNLRAMAFELGSEGLLSTLHSFFPCMLHQTNLMIGSCSKHVNERLVAGMHSYAKLLHMGNYFLRTVLAVELVLEEGWGGAIQISTYRPGS